MEKYPMRDALLAQVCFVNQEIHPLGTTQLHDRHGALLLSTMYVCTSTYHGTFFFFGAHTIA